VDGDRLRRDRNDVTEVARSGPDWVRFAIESPTRSRRRSRSTGAPGTPSVPGTVLFSGTVNRDVGCSSTWLAEHEYAIQDVNKSWFPRPQRPPSWGDELDDARRPLARRAARVLRLRRNLLGPPPPSCATATGPGPQKTTCRAHLPGGRALDRPAGRGATTRDAVVVEDGPVESTPQVP
jgi:hypothetical protein